MPVLWTSHWEGHSLGRAEQAGPGPRVAGDGTAALPWGPLWAAGRALVGHFLSWRQAAWCWALQVAAHQPGSLPWAMRSEGSLQPPRLLCPALGTVSLVALQWGQRGGDWLPAQGPPRKSRPPPGFVEEAPGY